MRLRDLDHVVAAAAQIVRETEFVIIGSQAILGSFPDAPDTLLRSQEADIYPRNAPEKAIDIEAPLATDLTFRRLTGTTRTLWVPRPPRPPPAGRTAS